MAKGNPHKVNGNKREHSDSFFIAEGIREQQEIADFEAEASFQDLDDFDYDPLI